MVLWWLTSRQNKGGALRQGRVGLNSVGGILAIKHHHFFLRFCDDEGLVDFAVIARYSFQIHLEILGEKRVGGHAFGNSVVVPLVGEVSVGDFAFRSVEAVDVFDEGVLDLRGVQGPIVSVRDEQLGAGGSEGSDLDVVRFVG